MIYLKIIFLKIVRFFAVILWNIIRFFRLNKNIDLKDIKKIIFNRKDRIWDAVITKPFIILFSKYVKEELKLDIEIEVECSKYNEFVFKEWNLKKYYTLANSYEKISNTGINIFWLLKQQFKNFITKQSKSISKKDAVYIDLVWNPDQINERKTNLNYYFVWPNLFLNNSLLDYSLSENYVSWVKINLIQSYINLISWCFKLDNFEKYIYDNIEDFYSNYNYSKDKKWILIFTWNKEYRNLDTKTREKLIKNIGEKYNSKRITVIDDNSNIVYDWLKNIKNFPKNIELIKNEFTLQELEGQARNYELIIWIDWWWFNYIRTCTDSITIYTIWNHHVWSIFTWKEKYKKEKLWNGWIMKKCDINWKVFWCIYKKSILLPSFDQSINSCYFKNVIIDNEK
jgi:hypothetical protein